MTHLNAPLSIEGRRRLVERCQTRPIAHAAAEMGVSRACASKWVNRYRKYGELGLRDRSSVPARQPAATAGEVGARIERMARTHKWSASPDGVRAPRRRRRDQPTHRQPTPRGARAESPPDHRL